MARIVAERADTLPAIAEMFREHGYEGASLSLIGEATGLGRGSLYHFFPGGKAEMAEAVLAEIESWFEAEVFEPLRRAEGGAGVAPMLAAVDAYFRTGRRACLVGALAISDTRDRFGGPIRRYFASWIDALADALERGGWPVAEAREAAEDVVAGIQGAIVLSRSLDDPDAFRRALSRLRARLNRVGP